MITRSELSVQTISNFIGWQQQLASAVTSPEELLTLLKLDKNLLPAAIRANREFSLRVPHSFISRMEPGNPDDPLLRQILPVGQECEEVEGFSMDPLAEKSSNPCEGIIHKYNGRLLLITSGACAVNCRFCFRRHFPYSSNQLGGEKLQQALDYIAADTSIKEVILSGGDPLAATDKRLQTITAALNKIDNVQTLRVHTRFPIIIPERITPELIDWFANQRLKPVMVIHCNHPNEIDHNVKEALNRLRVAGVTLLNQGVMLKNINDDVKTQADLSETLFDAGVLPYYMHTLDKVAGAAHFDIPDETAKQLMQELMAILPGYLVPKLVRDVPGMSGKTQVG